MSLTTQFFVVVLLLTVTSVIIKQVNFIESYDQGYQRSGRLLIPAPQGIGGSYPGFVNSVRTLSGVEHVGSSMFSFYKNYRETTMKVGSDEHKLIYNLVNEDFLSSMDIVLIEGDHFRGVTADNKNVILNETAAALLLGGVDNEILNSLIEANIPWHDHQEFRVIGVMKDFNFKSLKNELEPLVYFYLPSDAVGVTNIKFNGHDLSGLSMNISKIWEENGIDVPFEYQLMEEAHLQVYDDEAQLGRIAKSFAFIAFFLSLFGLIAFLSHSFILKNKEWAIKRVLGASPINIFKDLNWELLGYFGLSLIISLPTAYYLGDQWLSQFAYHFIFGVDTMILPALIALTSVLLIGIYFVNAIHQRKVTDVLKSE